MTYLYSRGGGSPNPHSQNPCVPPIFLFCTLRPLNTISRSTGRFIVLVFIAVGVVVIPVRTSQLWGQLASRRLTAGTLSPGRPTVLLSTRLSEVRGFADLTDEFFHQVREILKLL